jgi:hypothetical protein
MNRTILLLAAFWVVSCASVPMQESYLLSVEKRLQASENWKVLAEQIAGEVEKAAARDQAAAAGRRSAKPFPERNDARRPGPVFISDRDGSSFGRAMRTFLASEFVKHEVAMAGDATAAFRLDWLVQPVVHQAERKSSPSLLYILFVAVPQAVFLGEADFGFTNKPHTELIITFRLKKDDCDIFRQTHIYSINDADIGQYWDISEQGVVGSRPAPHADAPPSE